MSSKSTMDDQVTPSPVMSPSSLRGELCKRIASFATVTHRPADADMKLPAFVDRGTPTKADYSSWLLYEASTPPLIGAMVTYAGVNHMAAVLEVDAWAAAGLPVLLWIPDLVRLETLEGEAGEFGYAGMTPREAYFPIQGGWRAREQLVSEMTSLLTGVGELWILDHELDETTLDLFAARVERVARARQ